MKARRAFGALTLAAIVVVVFISAAPASASVTYSFRHILEDGDGPDQLANGSIGQAQLFVDVVDIGNNQVLFNFRNTGPQACFIRGVYFDDGSVLDNIAALVDADENSGETGVDFSVGANPPELPAPQSLDFQTTTGLLADADSPGTNKDGVDPGESLGVIFDLKASKTFGDVTQCLGNSYWAGRAADRS